MTEHVAPNYSREEHIRALIEQISAYIEQFHHGSVELVSIEGDTIQSAPWRCLLGVQSFHPNLARLGRRHYPPVLP